MFRVLTFLSLVVMTPGCVVSERCFADKDCQDGQRCSAKGSCLPQTPLADSTVPDGRTPIRCPLPQMVNVGDLFCVDRFEASRFDATGSSEGTSVVMATSRKGVPPWQGVDLTTARAACKAAGKYLCRLDQWRMACSGPKKTVYGYGDHYDPTICNGIDAYCACSSGPCAGTKPCPYPHCFMTCGADFKVDPTGSRSDCTSVWGADQIHDINGNVWELTDSTDGLEHFRGGAYNCSDSEALHRCDHDGTWGPSARGFRCCADGLPLHVDAGSLPELGATPDAAPRDLDAAPRDLDAAPLDTHVPQ